MVKQLAMLKSDKLAKVRVILLKAQLPVLSSGGGKLIAGKGFLMIIDFLTTHGKTKRIIMMRYIKNVIKVLNVQPKAKDNFWKKKTTVFTKGSNSYVKGGPELAAYSRYVKSNVLRR